MNKKFIHFILRQNKSKTGDPERNVLVARLEIITCLHAFSQLPANADYHAKIKQKEYGG